MWLKTETYNTCIVAGAEVTSFQWQKPSYNSSIFGDYYDTAIMGYIMYVDQMNVESYANIKRVMIATCVLLYTFVYTF